MVDVKSCLKAFGYKGVIVIDLQDLKRRYRVLSKKYHPDVYGNDKIFLDIQDKYNGLLEVFERDKLVGTKIDLDKSLARVRHGEFAFRYIIEGVEYRL